MRHFMYSRRLGGLLAFLALGLLISLRTVEQLDLLSFGHRDHILDPSSPIKAPSSIPHQPHPKRDHELLNRFGCLVAKGTKYFEEGVLYAAEGFADPPPDFGPDPLVRNGWTVSTEEESLPGVWDEVLDDIPPRGPLPDEYEFIRLEQNKRFANAWHQNNEETRAAYNGFYIPFSEAIIMTFTYSPRFQIRLRGVAEGQIEQQIPHLNTLTDVVWEEWKAITDNPASLRFYAVDAIINQEAKPLMDYLFERDRGTSTVEWQDRLTFGLDTDEGKALFGTPNGVAVAWLMIHHHDVLGRRDPRVSIFRDEGARHMIWELIPEGDESTFDDYKSMNSPIRQ